MGSSGGPDTTTPGPGTSTLRSFAGLRVVRPTVEGSRPDRLGVMTLTGPNLLLPFSGCRDTKHYKNILAQLLTSKISFLGQ